MYGNYRFLDVTLKFCSQMYDRNYECKPEILSIVYDYCYILILANRSHFILIKGLLSIMLIVMIMSVNLMHYNQCNLCNMSNLNVDCISNLVACYQCGDYQYSCRWIVGEWCIVQIKCFMLCQTSECLLL